LKVLAVDDNHAIVSLINDILTSRGHQVETAQDGKTALQKYPLYKPNMVTLDLMMPGMSGYETLTKILEMDRNAIVIMLSANGEDDAVLECMKRGAMGFLTKPFRPNELLDSLQTAAITAGIE
jgi:two-component system chemotaxis response regulator CheY